MGTNGKISGVTSDFSYTITRPVNCPSGNAPISGVYQGYFWIKFNPPRKILENKMHLYFTEHNGKYLVSGAGTNRLGPYDLEGIYDPTTLDLTCIKKYHPAPPKPRQSESSSHDSRVARSVCLFSIIHSQTTTNDVPSTVTPAMQNCFRLHMKLMNHKGASPFLHPVDPVALHIPDYFSIIKNPMDFGTIYARLLDGSLATEAEYLALVHRVFDNAILYNKPSDDVAVMAHTLSDYFERERLHMSELVAVEGDANTITTRRRSIKRSAGVEAAGGGAMARQYALRKSGSVNGHVRANSELPGDVAPYQYNALEFVLSRLKEKKKV